LIPKGHGNTPGTAARTPRLGLTQATRRLQEPPGHHGIAQFTYGPPSHASHGWTCRPWSRRQGKGRKKS
jgi:hypothetical protein